MERRGERDVDSTRGRGGTSSWGASRVPWPLRPWLSTVPWLSPQPSLPPQSSPSRRLWSVERERQRQTSRDPRTEEQTWSWQKFFWMSEFQSALWFRQRLGIATRNGAKRAHFAAALRSRSHVSRPLLPAHANLCIVSHFAFATILASFALAAAIFKASTVAGLFFAVGSETTVEVA